MLFDQFAATVFELFARRACELEVQPGLAHDYPEDFAAVLRRALAFVTVA